MRWGRGQQQRVEGSPPSARPSTRSTRAQQQGIGTRQRDGGRGRKGLGSCKLVQGVRAPAQRSKFIQHLFCFER